jgi:hypothetical protein
MLDIQTFDAKAGGNVTYKAFAHPVAAERLAQLAHRLNQPGGLAVYDPDGVAEALFALAPGLPKPTTLLVHDVELVGRPRLATETRGLEHLSTLSEPTLLIAAFDAARLADRIRHLLPTGITVLTLDEARLPDAMLTNRRKYLDRLNFATNFAFFRDSDGLSTRLVTANYWSNYGATNVRLWCRLFASNGQVLAEWEDPVAPGPSGIAIDSREIRARFGLPDFTGQLFIHAIGVAGHDVVKYALDTMGAGNERSLSVTHDANAWPSERYAGLPAPDRDERVTLWLQNSHAAPIPAGAVTLDRMGEESPVSLDRELGPFESVPVDVATLLPDLAWPAQIEVRAGRHVVRPRYEIVRNGRTRIAHMNVERADLQPDPSIPTLPASLGRGYLLPFPILPPQRFRTEIQPNPMAHSQTSLPLRLDVFAADGHLVRQRFLGNLPRCFDLAADFDEDAQALGEQGGHGELVYDFRDGGQADGWMHALVRFEDRSSGHLAETSFGAHIFNTVMTYRGEPQSYSGPPPGLSTRLFLKLGDAGRHSFSALIYPASNAWHPRSTTTLQLHASDGTPIAERPLAIACSGSALVFPHEHFELALIERAGPTGYVLIRDQTCRLFGYHGQMDDRGGFSLDHMFGF